MNRPEFPCRTRLFRRIVAVAAVAAGLLASALTRPSVAADPADDWPLFRGDSRSTGVARTTLPDQPALLWKYEVPKGSFEGTPVIAGGVVYIGDLDGTLYALELTTGQLKWKHTTESGFMASPAVRDGLVYLGDMDGQFRCVDAASGKLVWEFAAEAEIDSGANFFRDNVLFGSQDATLYCLDAKTGKLVWKHAIADQIRCTPTVVEDRCFVAGCDGQLHVIELNAGQETAAIEIGSPTGVTPAAIGDRVYFGTEAGAFLCVDWKQAKVLWTFAEERSGQAFRGSPAATDQWVVVGGRNKRIHALDPNTGKEVWGFAAKTRIDASCVIVGQRVFAAAADGRLYALDLPTGKLLWEHQAGGGFAGSPAVAAGRLVIASDDGVVYCFGKG